MTDARTTNADRLEFLRLWRMCLLSYRAAGKDIDNVINELEEAITRRERTEQPR